MSNKKFLPKVAYLGNVFDHNISSVVSAGKKIGIDIVVVDEKSDVYNAAFKSAYAIVNSTNNMEILDDFKLKILSIES